MMARILSIGSELDFADSVDWHEDANYKDYNIIFMNLRDLEQRSEEFVYPYYDDDERAVNFSTRKQVRSFVMDGGNDLIIALPSSSAVALQEGENQSTTTVARAVTAPTGQPSQEEKDENGDEEEEPTFHSCDLFSWLPARLHTEDTGGESVVLADNTEVGQLWEWYFDENFAWNLTLQRVGQRTWMTEGSAYDDPTSRPSSGSAPDEKYGPIPRLQEVAVNASNECIGGRIELFPRKDIDVSEVDQYPSPAGGIYLVPLKPSLPFADFARQVLVQNYGLFEEGLDHQPEWVQEYALPEEQRLRDRIAELQAELESLETEVEEPAQYKSLLYDVGDPLEDLVRDTLRDVGLEVSGEVPGKRDGIIKLDDQWIVLEIYGSTSGVTAKKYRQLTDWVENVNVEHPGKAVEGLLIANPFADEDPAERPSELLTGDPKRLMEQRGFHAIRTIDIYRMICGYRNDELSTADIEQRFASMDELIIDFDDVTSSPV